MSGRGKPLELGLWHEGKACFKSARAAIVRQYPRMAAGPDGTMIYAGDAPVDFLGARAGGHAIALEAKETDRESFPLDEDHLGRSQIAACRALVSMGVDVQLVIDYKRVAEVYAVFWGHVDAFLDAPWRASLSLDWARAYGLLLPEHDREDERLRRTLFLDGAPHPDQADCLLRVQTERQSRPVITLDQKLAADDARDRRWAERRERKFDCEPPRPNPATDPEGYRQHIMRLAQEGAQRALGAGGRARKPRRKGGRG
jgi:penicillin-binding protein-related factor A (putative recombinase)